jgi:hypothetical protein
MDIQRALNQRRAKEASMNEFGVQQFNLSGQLKISGAGETSVEVKFPVRFLEKPMFSCGWELEGNQDLVHGAFPGGHCVVYQWIYTDVPAAQHRFFTGAKLAIQTRGTNHQNMFLVYHFSGLSDGPVDGRANG